MSGAQDCLGHGDGTNLLARHPSCKGPLAPTEADEPRLVPADVKEIFLLSSEGQDLACHEGSAVYLAEWDPQKQDPARKSCQACGDACIAVTHPTRLL